MLDKLLNIVVNTPIKEEEQEFIDYVNSLHIYENPEEIAPNCICVEPFDKCYRFAETMLNHSPMSYYRRNGYKIITFKEFKEKYMEEKEIQIQVPEGYIIDEENSTFKCIKFKRRNLTYRDIARELFEDEETWFINHNGVVERTCYINNVNATDPNNCVTKEQAEKLMAINKLMNVATYLNGKDWIFGGNSNAKYTFFLDNAGPIEVVSSYAGKYGNVYFKSKELAKKALEILGEETIKLALS